MDERGVPPPRFGVAGHVAALERLSPSVMGLRIAVAGVPVAFLPGQYMALTLPRQKQRDYSLTWRSQPQLMEFFIRDHRGGGTSSFVAEQLQTGDQVTMDGPFGTMTLDPSETGPVLGVAGSTGIGPIAAIAGAVAQRAPGRKVELYWGAAREGDLFLTEELAALLPETGRLVLTAEELDAASATVRCGSPLDAIAADQPDLSTWTAYAAGPPGMVEAAANLLQSLGLPADAFRADAFFTTKDKQARKGS